MHTPAAVVTVTTDPGIRIACGESYSALVHTGTLYTWGDNLCGELGHGDTQARPTPQLVHALADVHITTVACGRAHTAAISGVLCIALHFRSSSLTTPPHTDTGVLYMWGCNDQFQLGLGNRLGTPTPTPVQLSNGRTIAVSCGRDHTVALCRAHIRSPISASLSTLTLFPPPA